MDPLVVVDFNGALFRSRPFDEAHKSWFKLFSVLLEDNSVNDWAFSDNYFEGVHRCMEKYMGSKDKETQTLFARQLYAMCLVAETREEDLVKEFADYLRTLRERYNLVLLTSAPEEAVLPMLKKVNCIDIFDIIYPSSSKDHPDKLSLFNAFISRYEKPLFYIGKGDSDLGALKDLDIKTICVNWVTKGKFSGTYNIDTVDELKDIF